MKKVFLIDVNLPHLFPIWNGDEYLHQYDLGDQWTDSEIWNYAEQNQLTIITKDSDFSSRIMLKQPPPKVIHIRVGNMKLIELQNYLSSVWNEILKINENYKLVNVFLDRIEGIM